MEGGPGHPKVLIILCAERGEDRDPILGLQPCRARKAARGQRKGLRRVARPLTRARLPPQPTRGPPRSPQVAPQQHVLVAAAQQ
ncbi:hypothetical protein NDU88_003035 [Pleurodeles waltl]|uniref:Uncharacterized protein n=1 Tax=Pleurodeles waltl TaxID=8319 RepID=A0AAV7M483_PLEWA|nr:hypothetical protein NDU88_003035 [Pleurodeles waltl]